MSTSNSDLKLAWPTIKKDKSAHAEALRDRDESDSIKDIIDKEEPQNVGPITKKTTRRTQQSESKCVNSKRSNKLSQCDLPTTGSNEPKRMNPRSKSDEPWVQ